MKIESVLGKLGKVQKTASGYKANCPLHGDDKQHLSISVAGDKILLKCWKASCDVKDICGAIGLEVKDLFDNEGKTGGGGGSKTIAAEYTYKDEAGAVVYQVVRYTPKAFCQRRPDGAGGWVYKMAGVDYIPFHLPELIKAVADKKTVYIAEGEKDVLNLEKVGLVATCNAGGAGKFRATFAKLFLGAAVVIIADKDDKGREHAQDVACKLWQSASSIKVIELPDRDGATVKDASDWLWAGGTPEELATLTATTADWKPAISPIAALPAPKATTTATTADGTATAKPDGKPEEFYYDSQRKEYLAQNSRGVWLRLTEAQLKKELARRGVWTKAEADGLSQADRIVMEIRDKKDIAYAGSLAGYKAGYYEDGGSRILVTDSPRIIEPKAGSWPTIDKFIKGLLHEDGLEQETFLLGWLKIGYETVKAGGLRPAQALAIAGTRDCGKSLLQKLMTEILGGRYAKPYQFMSGLTPFNADLFGAEHLILEDEQSSYDIRTRRNFGAELKSITVNDAQRLHAKGRDAVPLKPFWRLSITLNDEPENLMQLPPMDDSLEDKIIILRAHKSAMPMPTATLEQRQALWSTLVAELPAFCDYLLKLEIPANMISERFGITHFHHPAIVDEISALAPEAKLLTLIDACLFSGPDPFDWEGTAEELEKKLTDKDSGTDYEARRLLSWNTACGVYLARLVKKYPARFIQHRGKAGRRWIIKAPTNDDGGGTSGGDDGVTGFSDNHSNGGGGTAPLATLPDDGVPGCFLYQENSKESSNVVEGHDTPKAISVSSGVDAIARHPDNGAALAARVAGWLDDEDKGTARQPDNDSADDDAVARLFGE